MFRALKVDMKYEEIRYSPGSYEIELGEHDILRPAKDENGRFYGIEVCYETFDGRDGAHGAAISKLLFENEEIRLFGHFSIHKEFDGKLLGLHLVRRSSEP